MVRLERNSTQPIEKTLTLPGSKYLANRLLILSALSSSESVLQNMPTNDDILTSITGLSQLGATFSWQDSQLKCSGLDFSSIEDGLKINSNHSGSFSRFVLPLLAVSEHSIVITGSEKMNTRPMGELFRTLESMGTTIKSYQEPIQNEIALEVPETLPVIVQGPIQGGTIQMSGETSSQYISALLLSGAAFPKGIHIELFATPVSKPYLKMTVELIRKFGISISHSDDLKSFDIRPNQTYNGVKYELESDPSSASYFLAAAAITAGHICISNFKPEQSVQGEAKFYEVLEKMGCTIWADKEGFHCKGPKQLQSVNIDMCDMPDVVQTLAVVASFAQGTTEISNIATLAFKESNRIEDTATELRKLGIKVSTTESSLTIEGKDWSQNSNHKVIFDTYDDHRMAMSLALFGLKMESLKMNDHLVVSKSFPTFWDYMKQLDLEVT